MMMIQKMKKKKLIRKLAEAREKLRWMTLRYNRLMDKVVEARLANEMKALDPRWGWIKHKGSHDPKGV